MQQRIKLIVVKSMLLFSLLFFAELNIASATLTCNPLGTGSNVIAGANMASALEQVLRETEALYFGVRYSEVDAFKEDPSVDKSLITTFVKQMEISKKDIGDIRNNLEDKLTNWPDDYQNRKSSVEQIRGQLKTLLRSLTPIENAVVDNIKNISDYKKGVGQAQNCFNNMKAEIDILIKKGEANFNRLKNQNEITKKSIQDDIVRWKSILGHVQASEQSNIDQYEHMTNYMDKTLELLINLKGVLKTFVSRVNNVDTFLQIYSSDRMEIKHIPPRSNLDVNIGISANTLQELGDKLLIEPKKKNFNSSIQQQDYNMSELYSYAAFSTNFHVLVKNWTRVQDVLQKIGRIGIEKFVGKDLKVKKELTLHVGPADEELNMRTYPVGEIFTVGEDCVCDGKVCLDIGAEELCLDAAKFKEHFEEVEENFDSDDSSAGEKDEKDEAEGEGDESPIEEDHP